MPLTLDFPKVTARRDSFVVMVQGNALGSSVVSVDRRDGGWVVRESTNIMHGATARSTTLETDASLSPNTLVQSASAQGQQQLSTDIAFAEGRAKGSAMSPSPQGPKTLDVDVELSTGTLDSDALQVALPLFRWAEGATFTLNRFMAGKGTVAPVTLAVVGEETVTVPAGTFEAWKVEQTGGEASVVFYIEKEGARRVVKIAPAGQPIELQLAK